MLSWALLAGVLDFLVYVILADVVDLDLCSSYSFFLVYVICGGLGCVLLLFLSIIMWPWLALAAPSPSVMDFAIVDVVGVAPFFPCACERVLLPCPQAWWSGAVLR